MATEREKPVYWVELQAELEKAGLNASLFLPCPNKPWLGQLDEKPFAMSISSRNNEDGLRSSMIFSFFGQDEKRIIPLLSKLMGYNPFCRYKWKNNSDISSTYEWKRKDPNTELKKLQESADIYGLEALENGFLAPEALDIESYYQQVTTETITKWEKAIQKDPNAEFSGGKIKDFLPFVKKIMPRVGKEQSFSGLSIICLDGKSEHEEEIVRYGLEPLLAKNVISKEEEEEIVKWYSQTESAWHAGKTYNFCKEFELEGKMYRLFTDSYRNYRDLNLQAIEQYALN